MVGRYLSARTGIGPIRVGRREVQDKHRVTNEDLIAALSILQRDIRNLRAEVRAARQDSPRREGDQ